MSEQADRQLNESFAKMVDAKARAEEALERSLRAFHGATARQESLEAEIQRLHDLILRLMGKDA